MSGRRALGTTVLVVLAIVLQTAVVARLPLPWGTPDLVLVLVVALGLARGPAEGMLVGAGAGLLVDLLSAQALGSAALVLCVTGWLAGLLAGDVARSTVAALTVVAVLSLGAGLALAPLLMLTGQPHAGLGDLLERATATAAWNVALAPFVLPAVAGGSRRIARARLL